MIAVGPITIEKLHEHRLQQELEKAVVIQRWQENDLIFPTTIGTPRDPHNLLKCFKEHPWERPGCLTCVSMICAILL